MKPITKIISLAMALVFAFSFSTAASAVDDTKVWVWDDYDYTPEYIETLEHSHAIYAQGSNTRTSGLIAIYGLTIAKDGSYIAITGYTDCINTVTKCGFSELKVQRRVNSSSSWSVCFEFDELVEDGSSYTLSKRVSVPSGYQYRVVGTHYAYKNFFPRESIEGTTGIITL